MWKWRQSFGCLSRRFAIPSHFGNEIRVLSTPDLHWVVTESKQALRSWFFALKCKLKIRIVLRLQPMKTTLEKGRPFFNYQRIEDLEEELVKAIYVQRAFEEQIAPYKPQGSAPSCLILSFIDSKKKVQDIEMEIRRLRYSF